MSVGARRLAPWICSAILDCSGSLNTSAARAEASMTLTGIAIGADHGHRLRLGADPKFASQVYHLIHTEPIRTRHAFFEDAYQLTLQGTPMTGSAGAQLARHIFRDILDRQIHGHKVPRWSGSNLAPFWVHRATASSMTRETAYFTILSAGPLRGGLPAGGGSLDGGVPALAVGMAAVSSGN